MITFLANRNAHFHMKLLSKYGLLRGESETARSSQNKIGKVQKFVGGSLRIVGGWWWGIEATSKTVDLCHDLVSVFQ